MCVLTLEKKKKHDIKYCRCSPTMSQDSEGSADSQFRDAMRRKGLSVVDVEPDGNCLFRSVSHQIFGDAERHYQASGVGRGAYSTG